MTITIVLDGEYRYDTEAHARYQAAERFDPEAADHRHPREREKDPCVALRWPFRELVALSWLILDEVGGDLVPRRIETRGLPESSEESTITDFLQDVDGLFGIVRLVTWGGFSHDIPLMLLCAMKAGLTLPKALTALTQPKDRNRLPHVDLMELVCGGAKPVHLAEIAALMQIPVKVCCKADQVSKMMEQGKWATVKSVAEGDVLTTWAVLARHHRLGKSGQDSRTTDIRICQFVAAHRSHRAYAADFAAWQLRLEPTAPAHDANGRDSSFASADLCPQE